MSGGKSSFQKSSNESVLRPSQLISIDKPCSECGGKIIDPGDFMINGSTKVCEDCGLVVDKITIGKHNPFGNSGHHASVDNDPHNASILGTLVGGSKKKKSGKDGTGKIITSSSMRSQYKRMQRIHNQWVFLSANKLASFYEALKYLRLHLGLSEFSQADALNLIKRGLLNGVIKNHTSKIEIWSSAALYLAVRARTRESRNLNVINKKELLTITSVESMKYDDLLNTVRELKPNIKSSTILSSAAELRSRLNIRVFVQKPIQHVDTIMCLLKKDEIILKKLKKHVICPKTYFSRLRLLVIKLIRDFPQKLYGSRTAFTFTATLFAAADLLMVCNIFYPDLYINNDKKRGWLKI